MFEHQLKQQDHDEKQKFIQVNMAKFGAMNLNGNEASGGSKQGYEGSKN